jgi:NarL family two-component system sensor histidine kinase YdfH
MNKIKSHLKRLRSPGGKDDHSELFMEWPFFLILTLVLSFMLVQSFISIPALREPLRLIPFTILMIVHIVLHWLSVRLQKWSRVAIYLIVQSGLAFAIVTLGANIGLLLGLYIGLIGETIGLAREKPRWMIAAVLLMLGLSFMNYISMVGPGWHLWLLAMLPLTFFVAVYVTLYSRQAEARQHAQSLLMDLEVANRQLTDYAARVEDLTIANERQRMARELHDTLSQGLAGLILQLEAADAYLVGNRLERARAILQQSMEKARATLADARHAIDDLRQPAARNLAEVVGQEAERFTIATGIECATLIEIKGEIPDLVAETAVRAISEGLTNIARHARARNVTLRLTGVGKELEVEIGDDGVGFDPEEVQAGHYGLLGLRERVRLAGGKVILQSEPGKGTRIVIRFPLENTVHG